MDHERVRDRRRRQREVEDRTFVRLAFSPDAPALAIDDACDRREPDTRAVEVRRAVQPLERLEQLLLVSHVETGAVVANVPRRERAAARLPDLDARLRGLGGEFPGVADQVL